MYCVKCGAQLDDNAEFCSKCGTNQTNNLSPDKGYRAPNYEFKTVRCYPSDYSENKYKEFYENCGWTILDMDRKQEYTGQDSSGTRHYSTQTHIKMQRDKNMPNYEKIKELSDKAEEYFDTTPKTKSIRRWIFIAILAAILSLPNLFAYKVMFITILLGVVVGICILKIVLNVSKNKKTRTSYYANKSVSDKAYQECKDLVAKSK